MVNWSLMFTENWVIGKQVSENDFPFCLLDGFDEPSKQHAFGEKIPMARTSSHWHTQAFRSKGERKRLRKTRQIDNRKLRNYSCRSLLFLTHSLSLAHSLHITLSENPMHTSNPPLVWRMHAYWLRVNIFNMKMVRWWSTSILDYQSTLGREEVKPQRFGCCVFHFSSRVHCLMKPFMVLHPLFYSLSAQSWHVHSQDFQSTIIKRTMNEIFSRI